MIADLDEGWRFGIRFRVKSPHHRALDHNDIVAIDGTHSSGRWSCRSGWNCRRRVDRGRRSRVATQPNPLRVFPEIDFDQVDAIRGMDIAITTTAKTDAEAKALLEAFRFPFRN